MATSATLPPHAREVIQTELRLLKSALDVIENKVTAAEHLCSEILQKQLQDECLRDEICDDAHEKFDKTCFECKTTKTPQWRTVGYINYCNACGVRKKRMVKMHVNP